METNPNMNINLPEKERPLGSSLLRPEIPKGTTFNKKTIVIIVLAIGLIVSIAIITAFSPSKLKDNQDQENGLGNSKVVSNNINSDAINNVPDSYEGHNFNSQQIPDLNYQNQIPVQPVNTQPSMPTDTNNYGQKSQEEMEIENARKSQIRFSRNRSDFNQQKQGQTNSNPITNTNTYGYSPTLISPEQNQNGYDSKQAFFTAKRNTSFYTSSGLMVPLSKYEVKAGSVIPVTLITGINSDLPGYIIAQVRQNVYDTVTGQFLLIPQGTKIIGTYDSKIAYAQKRLLVAWTRMILPNGKSLDLEGMPGNDTEGYAGLKDKVKYHTGRLIVGGILTSLLGAGSKMITYQSSGSNTNPSIEDLAASGAAQNLSEAGTKIIEKELDVDPTIEIRPGVKFNVFVEKDLILETFKEN